jgi:hypothetical protein
MAINFNLTQAITLSVAVLGAVLGVINTWQGLNKSRLKLKVKPAHDTRRRSQSNADILHRGHKLERISRHYL